MAITLQPFIWFASFNFWFVGFDSLYYFIPVAYAYTPSNRHIAAAASFWHPCTPLSA